MLIFAYHNKKKTIKILFCFCYYCLPLAITLFPDILISLFDDRSQFDEFITKKLKETKKSSVGKSDEEST